MMIDLMKKFLLGLGTAVLIVGCGADISGGGVDEDADPGTADFSVFVALGDSLTAGFADSALYRHGQENSYPAIMAQQFALAGGGAFNQPLMPVAATGGLTLSAVPLPVSDRLVVVPTGNPDSPVAPATITPTVSTEIGLPLTGMFNNIGVPGARSYHVTAQNYGDALGVGGGTANPFYVRFRQAAAARMVEDAVALTPTFFVLWIGANDVLGYATSGGDGVQGAGAPPYAGENDITDPAVFPAIYSDILNGAYPTPLNTPTNKGVLVNIPDVTTIPFFTTVPHNAIPLDATTAATVNAAFAAYNAGVTAAIGFGGMTAQEAASRQINFVAGDANPILILDEALTDLTPANAALINMRQATPDDYILLTASTKLGTEQIPGNPTTVWGVTNPLIDTDVLTAAEVAIVEAARTQFNASIKAIADGDPNLALFDAAAKLTELNTTGISYGSGGISSAFIQGGGFSLDGVHPTARGYAVVANEIFSVINDAFAANIPPVDPNEYTTVFYQ
ncbi:MAG: G-D-S-L family lipolytic protein [Pseudomonadota bacterium]